MRQREAAGDLTIEQIRVGEVEAEVLGFRGGFQVPKFAQTSRCGEFARSGKREEGALMKRRKESLVS